MSRSTAFAEIAILAIALGSASCRPSSSAGEHETGPYTRTPVSTDIDKLARYVSFPARPASATWETLAISDPRLPGPTDWYLMALLHYSEADLDSIARGAQPSSESAALTISEIRPWFPASLKSAFIPSGGETLRFNGQSYRANLFYKGSLHDGYFVVEPSQRAILLYLQCCTATIR